MALQTARLRLDRSARPQPCKDLGIRFQLHSVASVRAGGPAQDMVLVLPSPELLDAEHAVGDEPSWNHLVCGLELRTKDGTVAQGSGQLLITGRRYIAMIDTGSVTGESPLTLSKEGDVYCFALLRDDVGAPAINKHMLTPADYTFRSKDDQALPFQFAVQGAAVCIANSKASYWHDKNMRRAISEEGRRDLL
jgi:hypothetical protein